MAHPRKGATTWKWGQTYLGHRAGAPAKETQFWQSHEGIPSPPSVEGQQEPAEPSRQRAQPRLKRGASCLATLLPEGQPQRPFGPGCREPSGASGQKSLKKRCALQVRPQPLPCSGCRPADGTAAHSGRKARSPGFPRGRLGLRHRPRAGPRSCRAAGPAGSQAGRREVAQPGGPPERRPRGEAMAAGSSPNQKTAAAGKSQPRRWPPARRGERRPKPGRAGLGPASRGASAEHSGGGLRA